MNTSLRFQKRCLAFAITSLLIGAAQADNAAVTVNVNANAGKHPISPYIYGVAFAPDSATLADLNAPLNRYGGNTSSTYNWTINASNHASDWYFESIPEDTATAGGLGDSFISTSKGGGAQAMLTIPMLDYVAKLGANRSYLWSFSQGKYGAQTGNDSQWRPDAGNGVLASTGNPITYTVATNPLDANVAAGVAFQKPWVQHLISTWGPAASGGLRFYILDNEHSIWQSTHQDTHPVGPRMTEISSKMISYSSMIKSLDPNAIVVGPEEYGWGGYFWSGYDQQQYAKGLAGCPPTCPDKSANGNMDYMPWLLKELYAYQVAHGTHILDVFSLHYYPQGDASGHEEYSDDVSSATQLLRNKSTRSLWDPNYVDASWESTTGNGNVKLIPRMKSWVSTYYPGLKTAITEYSWGAEASINGATAQADVDGIFGREGLDYATRWTTPASNTPTYKAMKMYRNYDGHKSGFGDNSVSATVPNPDNLSAFAATRSRDGALTVMVISKVLSGNTPVTVKLANFTAGTSAQAWQLTSANAITHLANVAVASGSLTATVPAQSITLFIIGNGVPVANTARNDFNGDGVSDILWRNHSTGADVIWKSAASSAQQAVAASNLDWDIVGVGDFDGDHNADILWRNHSTGANVIWKSANSASQQAVTGVSSMAWQVAGVADFNGDGNADILWRNHSTGANVIWSSANSANQQPVTGASASAWQVAGVGDFNGDGSADILWRNGSTGANVIWKSASSANLQAVTSVTNLAWQVAAVDDFNGDGSADILWRNGSTGANVIWRSANSANQQAVTGVTDLDWHVVGSGDYNGDNVSDILWRHSVTGANVIWKSAASTSQQTVTGVTDPAWMVER